MTLPEAYRPVVAQPYIPPASSTLHTEFQILDYVRATRKDSRNWWARCPSCAQAGTTAPATSRHPDQESPLYRCWAGCTKEEIRAALGQPIRRKVAV